MSEGDLRGLRMNIANNPDNMQEVVEEYKGGKDVLA